jgi:hypothetical protein
MRMLVSAPNITALAGRQVAAGGLSGAMMLVCVYPLEVVRTRLTANQARHRKDADFNGVLDCLRKTARQVLSTQPAVLKLVHFWSRQLCSYSFGRLCCFF